MNINRASIRTVCRFATLMLPILAMGAAGVEDRLRTGNAAYTRGDYVAALAAYDRAALGADDPGQVAFNQAAALYQLGRFDEAEQAYRRCLEDAEELRRVQAFYGLGNALARQGQELHGRAAATRLERALTAYKDCVGIAEQFQRDDVEAVVESALHNYRLVEELLVKKRAEPDTAPDPGSNASEAEAPRTGQQAINDTPTGPAEPNPREGTSPDQQPRTTRETQAGKGNLPPLLDDKDAQPIDPGSALDHLRSHMDRIRRDRSQRRSQAVPPSGAVRDW
jgi:tetratricopeptide (TPR) repeat protein